MDSFAWFLNKFSSGFILAFHEIGAERVTQFIECLHPAQPVPLDEIVGRSRQRKPTRGLFAITVDDGVRNTVRELSNLSDRRAWPMTFYLPTRYIDSEEGMAFQWWRSIQPLLPRRQLTLKSGVLDLSRPKSLERFSAEMVQSWHSRRLETYLPVIRELAEIVTRETGRAVPPPDPLISWEEVAVLSRSSLVRFESHAVSHAALSALTPPELEFELNNSRAAVSEHTGRPCRHLAYPFGSWESIGPKAVEMAGRYYDSAVTMKLGHVDFANPWLLPRIPLYPENSIRFARLKLVLKTSSLGSKGRTGPQLKPACGPQPSPAPGANLDASNR
jgi:peptidoglycan/xylan/chitin deacetylase (PgdA/CDA1 family)